MTFETPARATYATYPMERASQAFKRGFNDARDGRPMPVLTAGTFGALDYTDGQSAAWAEHHANIKRLERARAARAA